VKVTPSIDCQLISLARQKASALGKSLDEVVSDYLERWARPVRARERPSAVKRQRAAAGPAEGPSAASLPRASRAARAADRACEALCVGARGGGDEELPSARDPSSAPSRGPNRAARSGIARLRARTSSRSRTPRRAALPAAQRD